MLRLFFSLYFFLLIFFVFGIEALTKFYMSINDDVFVEDRAKDYNGFFLSLEELYLHLDRTQWEGLLEKIARESNTPTISKTFTEWQFPLQAETLLRSGEIYVEDHMTDILYKRVSEDIVVRIGPLLEVEGVELIDRYLELTILFIVAGVLLLWASWQQYKISRLAKATLAFSEGKFDSRAPEGWISVPEISRAFNAMAKKIQRLFLSHKELTNAVSHELRSPISRIRFQLALVDESQSKREREEFLKKLSENLDDMDDLVDEMLHYAKMERAELFVNLVCVEMNTWLKERCNYLQGETMIPLELNLPESSFNSKFDSHLFTRLLRNFVNNADQHGESRVRITLEKSGFGNTLRVDDDGPGIPIEQRKRVMEPFVRLDTSRNRGTGGYGLGLAIAAQIARCHHGELTIETSSLGGAAMVFTWPEL